MARKRMLDPSIWTDEGMAELTPRQQLLYIGLLSNADDEGRIRGSASSIRLILPTVYAAVDLGEVCADLAQVLRAMRQLVTYEADGREYLAFRKYHHWQKIDRPYPSSLPPPPDCAANGHVPLDEYSTNARRTDSEQSPIIPASRARAEQEQEVEGEQEEKGREQEHEARAPDGASVPDPVDWVWDYYKTEIQPEARVCPREKIRARLKRFAVDDLTLGIEHFRDDAWCMDHNRTRGGAWFFHDDNRSEHFLTMEPRAAPVKPETWSNHG